MLIGFILGAGIASFALLYLWRQRVTVSPEEAVLVIRRGTPNRIIFGDFVLMPFFERWEKIELKEQIHSFSYENTEALHTSNFQKINVAFSVSVRPKKDRSLIKKCVAEYGLKEVFSEEKVQAKLGFIFSIRVQEILKQKTSEAWINSGRERLEQQLKNAATSLMGFEITQLYITKLRSTDLEFYQENSLEDKKGLMSFRDASESLEKLEAELDFIAQKREELVEERKRLQQKQLEIQAVELETQKLSHALDAQIFTVRNQIQIQIDLLKSHLDVELAQFRKDAAHEAALLGQTAPPSTESESAKLRNRHRIEADMIKRELQQKLVEIEATHPSTEDG